MKRLLLGLIWFYQKAISPWFPARCRFIPTWFPAGGKTPGQVSALSSAEVHRI